MSTIQELHAAWMDHAYDTHGCTASGHSTTDDCAEGIALYQAYETALETKKGEIQENQAKAEWEAFQPEEGTIDWYDKFFVDQMDLGSPTCTPTYYRNVKEQLAEWKQEREDFGDDEAWLVVLREQYEQVQADIAEWDAAAAKEKTLKEIVKAVREHAQAHYDEGWDIVVEAYEDKEIIEAVGDATTAEQAIARMSEIVEVRNDRRQEVQAFADEYYV